MEREKLIERIREHVRRCTDPQTQFGVSEVRELADGVLAVCETDGEHTLYFDKSKCKIKSPFEDVGLRIPNFPKEDTGFIVDVTARSWPSILRTATLSLMSNDRKEIVWHRVPIKIEF